MKTFLLLLSLLLSLPTIASDGTGKPKRHPAHKPVSLRIPNLMARCSGDAYCRACSSCEYCGHCAGGGGTCGVCASYTAPAPRATRSYSTRRSSGRSASSTRPTYAPATPQTLLEVSGDYYVSASTLNLRAEPSAEAAVVRVLDRNEVVTVQELTNAKWARVTVATDDGEVEGYLSRAYLSTVLTY